MNHIDACSRLESVYFEKFKTGKKLSAELIGAIDHCFFITENGKTFQRYQRTVHDLGRDFIFDSASGLYLCNVGWSHEKVMSLLYNFYYDDQCQPKHTFEIKGDTFEIKDDASKYIIEGHGCYRSRSSDEVIWKGKDFKVPESLLPVFKQFENLTGML